MNLHNKFFRFIIGGDLSQDDYGRFIYNHGGFFMDSLIRSGDNSIIRSQNVFANDAENVALTFTDEGLIDLKWISLNQIGHKPDSDHIFNSLK